MDEVRQGATGGSPQATLTDEDVVTVWPAGSPKASTADGVDTADRPTRDADGTDSDDATDQQDAADGVDEQDAADSTDQQDTGDSTDQQDTGDSTDQQDTADSTDQQDVDGTDA